MVGKDRMRNRGKEKKGESKTEGIKVRGDDRKKTEQKYLCNKDQM